VGTRKLKKIFGRSNPELAVRIAAFAILCVVRSRFLESAEAMVRAKSL